MIMTLSYKLCTSVAQCICITISDQQEMGVLFGFAETIDSLVCSCVGIVQFFLITSFGDCTRR